MQVCVSLTIILSTIQNKARAHARLHARLPRSFLGMDAWITSQLNVALIFKLRGSFMCLAYFFGHVTNWCLNKRALADVRSTGAGIKWLYCTCLTMISNIRMFSSSDIFHLFYTHPLSLRTIFPSICTLPAPLSPNKML